MYRHSLVGPCSIRGAYAVQGCTAIFCAQAQENEGVWKRCLADVALKMPKRAGPFKVPSSG